MAGSFYIFTQLQWCSCVVNVLIERLVSVSTVHFHADLNAFPLHISNES